MTTEEPGWRRMNRMTGWRNKKRHNGIQWDAMGVVTNTSDPPAPRPSNAPVSIMAASSSAGAPHCARLLSDGAQPTSGTSADVCSASVDKASPKLTLCLASRSRACCNALPEMPRTQGISSQTGKQRMGTVRHSSRNSWMTSPASEPKPESKSTRHCAPCWMNSG